MVHLHADLCGDDGQGGVQGHVDAEGVEENLECWKKSVELWIVVTVLLGKKGAAEKVDAK